MRGIVIGTVIGAAVLVAVVVGALVVVPHVQDDGSRSRTSTTLPVRETTFVVDGRPYSCGVDSTVTLTVRFAYPGPAHGAYLDGVKLPDGPDPSDPGGEYFPVATPVVFPCTEHATHRLHQDMGRSTERYVGCAVELAGSPIPGEGEVTSGKNVTPVTNVLHPGDTVCDVVWRT